MPSSLQIKPFDVSISVYTADGTFYEPLSWTAEDNWHTCDRLANGTGGEQVIADRAAVAARTRKLDDELIELQTTCRHFNAVKAIKFAIELPYMKMLAPEEVELEEATWREWSFPRDWRTGFAVWQADNRYFTVATKDFPWHFKRMRALRTGDRMRLEIVQDANVRERTFDFTSSVWQIGYRDNIDAMLADHAVFVKQAFGASEFAKRTDMPAWARDVGLVVNMHCTDWNGKANMDFADMTQAAEQLAKLFPAEQTLLYPIGWDGRYMRDYPTFEPSPGLGGHEGCKAFADRVHELGFHVMPHLNAMVCNMNHRLYLSHLKDFALRTWQGRRVDCLHIDWDHDGLGDQAHSYLSLVPPALRDTLIDVIDRLVTNYGFDSVFLDETCNIWYNDPAWDQVDGMRRLVRDIRRRFPQVLIVGEEWSEPLLGLTPIVQIWEETADGRGAFGRQKSPLLRRWVGQFIRSCGYLALASPDGTTGVHEWPDKPWVDEQENEAYYIPTLSLTSRRSMELGMDAVLATVKRAKNYVAAYVSQ